MQIRRVPSNLDNSRNFSFTKRVSPRMVRKYAGNFFPSQLWPTYIEMERAHIGDKVTAVEDVVAI